ncbi:hypothetical protein [Geothrix campi]|uniref:hypothetical protein n=1 Tax=Geothrix campi TaxID=2966450 RepID=UPI0021489F87|nr:hypothetical protein [Geothrix sp. SG10]
MSNLIFACWRGGGDALAEGALRRVADRITGPGLAGHPHRVTLGPREGLCLTGPVGAAVVEGLSARLGALAGVWTDWHVPRAPVPDGTFALLRTGETEVELCSDFAGSRTLWYTLTATHFFASTSQRALVCLLESLDLNRAAFAWFLSSGSLGPTDAWDRRIHRLPPDARLTLDRTRWTLDLQAGALEFRPQPMEAEACRMDLQAILRAAIRRFDFKSAHWALPLSGGYDSRFILATLVEAGWNPPTMTWGLAASLTQPGNDAFIARQLAERLGLSHDYLLTEQPEVSPEEVVDRFLAASGGTTDQLFPYLDGLHMWATFAERGIAGVIRGDEGFGWIPVRTVAHARSSVGLVLLKDCMEEAEAEEIADGGQRLPEGLEHQSDESISTYRDRLYHGYRIPVGLAALNAVKAPFVEIASPLLEREVLAFVRRMPDVLRTDKAVFCRIAKAAGPPLPYATMGADDDRSDYLRSEPYLRWFREELESGTVEKLLPETWRARLQSDLRGAAVAAPSTRSLRAALKRIVPGAWVRAVRARMGPEHPSRRLLVLRTALASRMVRLLEADAGAMGGRAT